MEELIAAKKHFSKIGWFYLIAIAVIYAVEIPLVFVVSWFWPQWLDNGNINVLLSMIPMYGVGFPLLTFLMKRKVPAVKIEKRRMTAGQYVLAAIICMGLAYAANLIGTAMTVVIGLLKGSLVENEIASVIETLSPGMVFFYTVLCAPIVEEFIFRKLIVDRTVRYGQSVAVVVSGIMFGLFHGNLNQFVYAATIGMFLAYLYAKTGNLKITISLHMLFNFVGGFLSSLLLRIIDLDGYMAVAESGDIQELMNYFMSNLAGWIAYALMALYVCGMLVAGIVLFIVFLAKRRFTFEKGEIFIPRQLRFNIAFANAGMLAFGIFWIVQIVVQLLQ